MAGDEIWRVGRSIGVQGRPYSANLLRRPAAPSRACCNISGLCVTRLRAKVDHSTCELTRHVGVHHLRCIHDVLLMSAVDFRPYLVTDRHQNRRASARSVLARAVRAGGASNSTASAIGLFATCMHWQRNFSGSCRMPICSSMIASMWLWPCVPWVYICARAVCRREWCDVCWGLRNLLGTSVHSLDVIGRG